MRSETDLTEDLRKLAIERLGVDLLGVAPVAEDGSAYFVVPANRNVYFEALDSDGWEVQRMRSVVCLKPGEARSCIGCHEPRNMAPPATAATALRGRPSRPVPPPWGNRIVSYLRDVQPVLNAHCTRCHDGSQPKRCDLRGTLDAKSLSPSEKWVISGEGSGEPDRIQGEEEVTPVEAPHHMQNFLDCVRSRQQPIAPIEAGYAHSVAVIMADEAYTTGHRMVYDSAKREVRAD